MSLTKLAREMALAAEAETLALAVERKIVLVTRADGSYALELPIEGEKAKQLFDRLKELREMSNSIMSSDFVGAL